MLETSPTPSRLSGPSWAVEILLTAVRQQAVIIGPNSGPTALPKSLPSQTRSKIGCQIHTQIVSSAYHGKVKSKISSYTAAIDSRLSRPTARLVLWKTGPIADTLKPTIRCPALELIA